MHVKPAAAVTFALLLALLVTGCTPQATAPTQTPDEVSDQSTTPSETPSDAGNAQLGAQIFSTGKGADGAPIEASAGAAGACSRCHGADAKGAAGPDIRWSVLTGAASSSRAPRFTLADEAAFATAVTTGSARGNELGPMMPRFQLTPEQISALVAYLKTL
jgi:mono/diheme cytochrome c family protein